MSTTNQEVPVPRTARWARTAVLAAGFAALAVLAAGDGARAADSGGGAKVEQDRTDAVPGPNWRTRDVLDAQRRSRAAPPPSRGAETGAVMDNYIKSIGKGGAGAELTPGNGAESGSMGR